MKILLILSVCVTTFHLYFGLPTTQNGAKPPGQMQGNELHIGIPIYEASGKQPENEESDQEESHGTTPEDEVLSDEDIDGEELGGPMTKEEEEKEVEEAELDPLLFEGDLKLSEEEIKKLDESTLAKTDVIAHAARKWPRGIVPIIAQQTLAKEKRKLLRRAIRAFKNNTCIRFVKKKGRHKNYIKVIDDTNRKGCYSTSVGKRGGEQIISIGAKCKNHGSVIHELMHAIGFYHEHSRLDRDKYITINWVNIKQGKEGQFKQYPHGATDYLNEPYDYGSIMHYTRNGFAKAIDGVRFPTIIPKVKPWRRIGQRKGFSAIDLRQINKLYNCTRFTSTY